MTTSAPAPPVSSSTCLDVPAVGDDAVVGPDGFGELDGVGVAVDHEELSPRESALSTWMPMCPSPPAPITTQVSPGRSRRAAFAAAW